MVRLLYGTAAVYSLVCAVVVARMFAAYPAGEQVWLFGLLMCPAFFATWLVLLSRSARRGEPPAWWWVMRRLGVVFVVMGVLVLAIAALRSRLEMDDIVCASGATLAGFLTLLVAWKAGRAQEAGK